MIRNFNEIRNYENELKEDIRNSIIDYRNKIKDYEKMIHNLNMEMEKFLRNLSQLDRKREINLIRIESEDLYQIFSNHNENQINWIEEILMDYRKNKISEDILKEDLFSWIEEYQNPEWIIRGIIEDLGLSYRGYLLDPMDKISRGMIIKIDPIQISESDIEEDMIGESIYNKILDRFDEILGDSEMIIELDYSEIF